MNSFSVRRAQIHFGASANLCWFGSRRDLYEDDVNIFPHLIQRREKSYEHKIWEETFNNLFSSSRFSYSLVRSYIVGICKYVLLLCLESCSWWCYSLTSFRRECFLCFVVLRSHIIFTLFVVYKSITCVRVDGVPLFEVLMILFSRSSSSYFVFWCLWIGCLNTFSSSQNGLCSKL